MRALVFTAMLLGLAACGPSGPPVATAADAQRANVAIGELEAGRMIAVSKCGNCHVSPLPTDNWDSMLDDMVEKAKLDPEQRRLYVQYMTTMDPRKR